MKEEWCKHVMGINMKTCLVMLMMVVYFAAADPVPEPHHAPEEYGHGHDHHEDAPEGYGHHDHHDHHGHHGHHG
ncbi:hypothetical protein TNCV_4094831 [Trichonephila clavipes]|uniref:Uncharacterized protein n=1 Tax=Trichonephila clavipes TaxID=2585209 RepID=A0A8X6VH48_TRICX|nr:hypothetical protein TNCV_4094831 [Trichonephila clavipes]